MSDQVAESASGSRKGSRGKGKGKRRSTGSESRGADSSNWRVREQPESGGADSSTWRAVREPEVEASAPATESQQGGEGDRKRQPGGKGKGKGKSKHKNKERNDGDEGFKDQSKDTKNPSQVRKERKAPELSRMQTPEYGSVTERLADQLSRGTYDCMICLNKVKPSHQIWPCDQCWAVFHLKCIKSWIQRCNSAGGLEFDWACPGCRYHRVDLMPKYSCYCKKLDEPELNPHWLAHSCGDVCEKDRGCPHKCPELCHPGPCPRCTAVGGPGRCHCGKESSETTRCGDPKQWSCGAPCGRTLSCSLHSCKARCHQGPCPPCAETSQESCYCGKTEEMRLCGQSEFSCRKPCGKLLDCKEHFCERECHPGDCGTCLRDPVRWGDRCACGKTYNCSHESARARLRRFVGVRKRCSQPLALCNQLCMKRHERCSHLCEKNCHEGSCGQCEAKVQRECRCSRTRREVVCSEVGDVTCHQVCRTKKTCGNHKCDTVCCEGFNNRNHEAHICLQVCGRPLSCGNHTCEEFCHLGNCPPCRVVVHEPIFCACGKNSIEPPSACGREAPNCQEPCAQLMDCGHVCPATCHQGEHPMCYEPVDRLCLGGHMYMKNKPCHVGSISCGQSCGKQLACGHSCSSQCHAGECKDCSKPCGARRVHCSHTCQAPCHPGSECEDTPCRCKVKQACPCGQRVEERSCGAYSELRRPQWPALRCLPSCERPSLPPFPEGEPVKYTADLFQLASQHRRYVQMLEETFATAILSRKGTDSSVPGRTPATASQLQALPSCESSRRLLAIEYARSHWRFKTSSKSDAVEGWWQVSVAATASSRFPRPLLSEIASSSGSSVSGHISMALSSRPCLRFVGLKSLDEVYDLVSAADGLLGVRSSDGHGGEAVAFVERGALGANLFRRLTGQEPGADLVPVRTHSAWGQPSPGATRLRVKLEQTLTSGSRTAPRPKPQLDAWESKEEVPDTWEDM